MTKRLVKLFISYSDTDEKFLSNLELHLTTLKREGILDIWHNRKISAGTEWKDEIDKNLNSADIILLLISADFIASDYCFNIEVEEAITRHEASESCVIPILVRPVDWSGAPFSRLQPLPINKKAITTWKNQDEAFLEITQNLRSLANKILISHEKSPIFLINSLEKIDSKICQIRDYELTISNLVDETQNSFDMILRSGKILQDCFINFTNALERGCHIRVIVLNNHNPHLIRSMSYESEDSLESLQSNFKHGEIAQERLINLSKTCKGTFEVEVCNHYLPSQLVYISTSKESKGFVFATPLKYKRSPRRSPSILTSIENEPEIFQSYQNEFNLLWEYIKSDKDFDSSFDISQALLEVGSISSLSAFEVASLYQIFQRWGFVILRPKETREDSEYFDNELLSLKRYFGNDFQHERSNSKGISTIKLEPGWPNHFSTTNVSTGLHTDGSYDKDPPKIVIHQCVVPSTEGGETLLASFKHIYRHIINDESLTRLLSCPSNTFIISRKNRTHTRSVFCGCDKQGRIEGAFRSDRLQKSAEVFFTSDGFKNAFRKLDDIIHDKENFLTFKLQKFDILVLDNTSVLHGRNEFENNSLRTIHRLMLDGNVNCYPDKLCLGFEP